MKALDRFCAWAFPEPDPEDPNYPWYQHAVDPKHVVILNLVVFALYGGLELVAYLTQFFNDTLGNGF